MRLKEIVIAAYAAWSVGCMQGPAGPQPDMRSPRYGIGVISNGHLPDLDLTDQKYEAMLDCLGEDPDEYTPSFIIEIMGDGENYPCPTYDDRGEIVGTKECAGRWVYWDGIIQVVESQSALAHELGHAITGDFTHDSGSPSIACGDVIDGRYNRRTHKLHAGAYPDSLFSR